ncbi:hypothetical protein [Paraliomyxa miuraensis]|uniref:hypothetical protein n=1 Tax=Paraliomyxa miuraensis TaxID=376150 RepID=UPI00225B60D3|nr:hypothetical protein [Paraliomyxa miuraensis]
MSPTGGNPDETETGTASSTTGPTTGPATDGSATVASADGTATTTNDTATTVPLDDSGTTTSTSSGDSSETTTSDMETTTGGIPDCTPVLAEVQYDPQSGEDMEQWVRLYNPCAGDIDLGDYSLGWGGADYTHGTMDLGVMGPNTISAGGCFVVGGPISNGDNQNANFDLELDFNPNMIKSSDPGNGVALFFGPAASIMADTIPVDAVIYGNDNDNDLLDADGSIPKDPHVSGSGDKRSIRRTAIAGPGWEVANPPTPNDCPMIP